MAIYPTTLFRVRAATLRQLKATDDDDQPIVDVIEAWLEARPHPDYAGAPTAALRLGEPGLELWDFLKIAGRAVRHPQHLEQGVGLECTFGLLNLTGGLMDHYVMYLQPEDVVYTVELFELLRARPRHPDLDDRLGDALNAVIELYVETAMAGDALVNVMY